MESLTAVRKDIFQFVDRALHGQRVEFLYKGTVFRIVPEVAMAKKKLDSLIGEATLAPGVDIEIAKRELSAEMVEAWDRKWDDL